MKKILQKLGQYWFSPMPAQRLALLRIASGAFTLWYFITRYGTMSDIARSDQSNYEPVGLANFLPGPLPPEVFMGIVWLTLVLGIAYLVGWKFRFTGLAFGIASLFVFSYRYSWSMIYHDNIAVVLHVLAIAISPAADAYSVDARLRRQDPVVPHWRYGWPVRLLCAATALTYFVSGLAKVFGELAWEWIDGSAMRSQVAVDSLRKEMLGEHASPLFSWIYAHHELFLIMGIVTMIVELGAPFFIWNKYARMGWALLTWSMHWGIFFIMGITFRYQMSGLIFLSFFDVEKAGPWLRSKLGPNKKHTENQGTTQPTLALFDGVCNFCNATVRFIAERDPKGNIHFASLQSAHAQSLLQTHGIRPDLSSIVVIEEGRAYQRSTAVLRIARRMGGLWPLAYAFVIVPVPLRDWAYTLFAKRRYRWFGRSAECPIPTPALRRRFVA
jgi:predicted DCC family thiol-disulfide oxidoreductase YuxK